MTTKTRLTFQAAVAAAALAALLARGQSVRVGQLDKNGRVVTNELDAAASAALALHAASTNLHLSADQRTKIARAIDAGTVTGIVSAATAAEAQSRTTNIAAAVQSETLARSTNVAATVQSEAISRTTNVAAAVAAEALARTTNVAAAARAAFDAEAVLRRSGDAASTNHAEGVRTDLAARISAETLARTTNVAAAVTAEALARTTNIAAAVQAESYARSTNVADAVAAEAQTRAAGIDAALTLALYAYSPTNPPPSSAGYATNAGTAMALAPGVTSGKVETAYSLATTALQEEHDTAALEALRQYAATSAAARATTGSNSWWTFSAGGTATLFTVTITTNVMFSADFEDSNHDTLYPAVLSWPFDTNGWSGNYGVEPYPYLTISSPSQVGAWFNISGDVFSVAWGGSGYAYFVYSYITNSSPFILPTADQIAAWNAKADGSTTIAYSDGQSVALSTGGVINVDGWGVSQEDRDLWDQAATDASSALQLIGGTGGIQEILGGHIGDSSVHISENERSAWNAKINSTNGIASRLTIADDLTIGGVTRSTWPEGSSGLTTNDVDALVAVVTNALEIARATEWKERFVGDMRSLITSASLMSCSTMQGYYTGVPCYSNTDVNIGGLCSVTPTVPGYTNLECEFSLDCRDSLDGQRVAISTFAYTTNATADRSTWTTFPVVAGQCFLRDTNAVPWQTQKAIQWMCNGSYSSDTAGTRSYYRFRYRWTK